MTDSERVRRYQDLESELIRGAQTHRRDGVSFINVTIDGVTSSIELVSLNPKQASELLEDVRRVMRRQVGIGMDVVTQMINHRIKDATQRPAEPLPIFNFAYIRSAVAKLLGGRSGDGVGDLHGGDEMR